MDHSISTESYLTQIKLIDSQLLFFKREHHYLPPQSEYDVFGNFWTLGFAHVQPNTVSCSHFGKQPLSGRIGLLIPPYSIIEWLIQCPFLQWSAFIWRGNKDMFSIPEAIVFDYDSTSLPESLDDIHNLISRIKNSKAINKINVESDIAAQIKTLIDLELGEELPIATIASKLNLEPPSLTRIFKRTFGLTPIVYRNKLRIYDSMFRLLFSHHKNISDIGFEVGFSDLSRFNKEFKKYTLAKPSQYQRRT